MAVIYTKKQKKSIIIRVSLLVALLIVIVTCVVLIFNSMKTAEGYQEIKAENATISEASGDYKLEYYVDSSNGNTIAANNSILNTLYSKLTDKAYSLLSSTNSYDGLVNVSYINQHPNQVLTIDSFLYDSLYKINSFDERFLLMGGINQFWESIMYNSLIDYIDYDPASNADSKAYIEDFMLTYQDSISIDFLSDNKIRLNVSDTYVKQSEEIEYVEYINFGIFFEALVMDYVKEGFNSEGYYNGYMTSLNGYSLDFGTKDELLQGYNLLGYRYSKTAIYGSGSYKSGYAYVNSYEFNITASYPYYSYELNGDEIRRDLFISLDNGLSNCNNMAYFLYKNSSLTEAVYDMYKLKVDGIKEGLYLVLDENLKATTNIRDLDIGSIVEVLYE